MHFASHEVLKRCTGCRPLPSQDKHSVVLVRLQGENKTLKAEVRRCAVIGLLCTLTCSRAGSGVIGCKGACT